jgi:uncharacterized protein (TIGR02680 family)
MGDAAGSEHSGPERWRPTRVGIRNIWEYDDQEFNFVDGRLILRGPNGSGKSNALALLVPFVFDAIMSSGRMDPFGGGRSMKTLLLSEQKEEGTGTRFRRDQRTGYVWMELSRGDRYLTIGCGARASVQRDAEAWFFVTDRRPGEDLDLVPEGTPMTRVQLAEALGSCAVYDTAESYRVAVDRALFGIGPDRYRHLVDLLLVLRRPHLAGKLHPEELSAVLTQGLPPVPDTLVAEVAASFEDLEAVKNDLLRLRRAGRAVDDFCPLYRSYLRTVARSRADRLLEAVRATRRARSRLAESEQSLAQAVADLDESKRARDESGRDLSRAEERLRAVLESPAFRDAAALITLTELASDARKQADGAAGLMEEAARARDGATAEVERAAGELRAVEAEVDRQFADTARAADSAGVSWSARRDELLVAGLATALRSPATFRLDEISQVRRAIESSGAAAHRATDAEELSGASGRRAEEAASLRDSAERVLDEAVATLVEAVRAWCGLTGVLTSDEQQLLVEVAGGGDGRTATTLTEALNGLFGPKRRELGVALVRIGDRRQKTADEREQLVQERNRVADDPLPAPDRLAVRPADRAGRSGAPLFACCDFREGVVEDDRSGIEAALHAAGLLDAWVSASRSGSGSPPDDTELDAWLVAGQATDGPSLNDILAADPASGSGLDRDVVTAVLRSIPLSDTGIGILPDGRFSLGPLSGRYAKGTAEFIGSTAREARRQRRLAELDAMVAGVDQVLLALDEERLAAEGRLAELDSAEASLPPSEVVVAARADRDRAATVASERRASAERAQTAAVERRKEAALASEVVRTEAARLGLPADSNGLDDTTSAVRGYEELAGELLRLVDRAVHLGRQSDEVAGRMDRCQEALDRRQQEHRTAEERADGLAARVTEMRQQLGPDAEAPLRRRQELEDEVVALKGQVEAMTEATIAQSAGVGSARSLVLSATEAVEREERGVEVQRSAAAVLARTEVWDAVSEGGGDDRGDAAAAGGGGGGTMAAPSDLVELCRYVVRATGDVDAGPESVRATTNQLDTAYRVLMDGLQNGFEPAQIHDDGVGIVQVTSETGTISVLQLARELATQVAQHEELLDERDQEIFERHLLTRVSEALRDLLNSAHELVEDINACLRDTPTASGLRVRLRWQLDQASTAQQEAMELLRKTPELLGPDERERLRRFFAGAIAEERAVDPGAGYEAVLTRVFDYRSWHSFVPFLVLPTGGSRQLTRAVFRSLSGGEQSVSLHLPLFAAAAAHYNAAGDGAPRLIALDEAFAGIDEGMRADLMGLLVRFDLDVIMTGHELWGAYEQVPGVMIYDLLRRPPAEGVSSMPMRWDGGALVEERGLTLVRRLPDESTELSL